MHSGDGLAQAQRRAIPPRAARELMVNGVTHRDWRSPQPNTIDHIGDTLTVTSPCGLPGNVRPDNIITHPSSPRCKSLAEREGVGVDRMMTDILTRGLPDPEIIGLLAGLHPALAGKDLDIVLLIDHLSKQFFVDLDTAQPLLQRPRGEAEAALARATATMVASHPLLVSLKSVPDGHEPAYRLSDPARAQLASRTKRLDTTSVRTRAILSWARHRGRVSSTEVADLLGLSIVRAGQILTSIEARGDLSPGKQIKAGRGFFYIPT